MHAWANPSPKHARNAEDVEVERYNSMITWQQVVAGVRGVT